MSPMASIRGSKERAAAFRRWALSLEKAISIGFRSGEYCGRKSIHAPCARKAASALALLWTDRLSRIKIVWLEGRGQLGFDIGIEVVAIHRTMDHPRRGQPIATQAHDDGLGTPFSELSLCFEAFAKIGRGHVCT